MDWNWFFSSLSQSAAAIVGLFGAFIITKILNNQSNFFEKTNRCKELLNQSRRIMDSLKDFDFELYNFKNAFVELKNIKYECDVSPKKASEEIYKNSNFSALIPHQKAIKMIDKMIGKYKDSREINDNQLFSIYQSEFSIPSNLNGDFWGGIKIELQKQRDYINKAFQDAKQQVRLVSNALDSVKGNPESSPQITYALILVAVLFVIGVISPLCFLPANPNHYPNISMTLVASSILTTKGIMLISVSLIFVWILSLFFIQNIKMKYSKKMIEEMELYATLSTYSEYFKIRIDNENKI